MTGVYVTLISGFIGLFGWECSCLAAGTDPLRFGRLANRYASWMQQYFDALADSDVPVVMIHDDIVWTSGGIFRPAWYREYVFPNYKKYFAPLLESGKKVMFCSDGNFDRFIDDIAGGGRARLRLRAPHQPGDDRREVWADSRDHRQRRHAHPAERHTGRNPRRGGALHGMRKGLPGLLHGGRQPHPAQYPGGKRAVLQPGL